MAIISILLLAISVLYLVSSVFVNIGLVAHYISFGTGIGKGMYADPDAAQKALLTVILTAVMLFIYLGVIFIPSLVSEKKFKRQELSISK
jgi:hypothetical protein